MKITTLESAKNIRKGYIEGEYHRAVGVGSTISITGGKSIAVGGIDAPLNYMYARDHVAYNSLASMDVKGNDGSIVALTESELNEVYHKSIAEGLILWQKKNTYLASINSATTVEQVNQVVWID